MTLWIRTRDGCVRLSDPWQRHLYVSGPPQALADLAHRLGASGASYEKRRVRLQDWGPADVLKVPVNSSRGASALAEKILRLGGYAKFQLYNVDIPPDQMYLYQKGLFPLAYTEAWEGDRVKWRVLDSVEDIDYQTPPLTSLELRVEAGTSRLPRLQDPLRRIILQTPGEEVVIDAGDEEGKLLALCEAVRRLDPDVITTRGGNAFTLPYLARRAAENQVEGRFILGREEAPTRPAPPGGASYFSYGRVYYRPRAARILGRLHVDLESSPLYPSCGLEGIIEVSRVCRMPLQRAVNSTIGSVMTSLQMYHAVRSGLLIPWRKTEAEEFKTARELLLADRGGLIYEPRIGAHDDVWEIDFASLYPMIMMRRNISPETVSCTCCPDSPHRVPELGTPICQRRRGFIPSLLELLIRKRLDYKRMRDAAPDEGLRTVYDRRQAALKWILVTCFGYLGFRNASFGKIDAHIATCAFARDVLVRASRLAEERGFQILHGIVDCLWLKKPGSDPGDLDELCAAIQDELGFPVALQGRYRWVVFPPSKTRPSAPVLNRYYGVFTDGRIKARGIELQRRDTPKIVRDFQAETLRLLAAAPDSASLREKAPETLEVARRYIRRINSRDVDLEDLAIRRRLSKDPGSYAHNVPQAAAAQELVKAGARVSAGQEVSYIVTDANRLRTLATPLELADAPPSYDARKYIRLITSSANTLIQPLGYTLKEDPLKILKNEKRPTGSLETFR